MPDSSRYQFIKVEVANKLATVTLNRPEAMNSTNPQMHAELEQVWVDLAEDAGINAILLTGAGRAFSAGGDVKAMAARYGTEEGKQRTLTLSAGARRLIQNMLDVGQPIIGAINGDAMGLGATIALFCDVIVVSETARLADTHVKVGIVAGDGDAVIWPLLIGPARAKEFLMRGKIINGAEAAQMGLVNYAVPVEAVLPKAREIAQELADGATWAIRWSKLSVNKWLKGEVNWSLVGWVAYEMLTFHTDDHREAAQAFVDKRSPKFSGR